MMNKKTVLISSVYGSEGGVVTMVDIARHFLKEEGYSTTLAYPVPYAADPEISVPFWQLGQRKPANRIYESTEQTSVGIGVYLPELEFSYYLLNKSWKMLIERHAYHMAISGNCLAALPLVQSRVPLLGWVASPYYEDKRDRAATFHWARRAIDTTIISPAGRALEKFILTRAPIMTLSKYTEIFLRNIAREAKLMQNLPIPIDRSLFNENGRVSGTKKTIGFIGRALDPRKNIRLLLEAAAHCVSKFRDLKLWIIGCEPTPRIEREIRELLITDNIVFAPYMARKELVSLYRQLDLFVIPSLQEGLCIAGLEAMSCGCPVVSTRCGGPEDFVMDGMNGYIVDFDAHAMAEKICQLLDDRVLWRRFSEEGIRLVEERYSLESARRTFWRNFDAVFSERGQQ